MSYRQHLITQSTKLKMLNPSCILYTAAVVTHLTWGHVRDRGAERPIGSLVQVRNKLTKIELALRSDGCNARLVASLPTTDCFQETTSVEDGHIVSAL